MIIQHNLLAQNADRQYGINHKLKGTWMERLSSGYRINRAADDAAGLAISEEMRGQIRGLNRGAQNTEEGINFCMVAEGALNEVHEILQRVRELAVQGVNDTNVSADREAIQFEINALKKEINRISLDTEYNTIPIFAAYFEIDFSDDIHVIQIFNSDDANNPDFGGDPTNPASYGGIIINSPLGEDTRVSWADIDGLVDDAATAANGVTTFNEGTFVYNTGYCDLTFESKAGSNPPEIKVSFPVSAETDGLHIAGQIVPWENVLNEDDVPITENSSEGGFYHFAFGNGEGSFSVSDVDGLNDIIRGINNCNQRYHRKYINKYSGYYTAQAVDAIDRNEGAKVRVKNSDIPVIKSGNLGNGMGLRIGADTTKLWLEEKSTDISGTETWTPIKDSDLTWDSLKDLSDPTKQQIRKWDGIGGKDVDGNADVSDQKEYDYQFKPASGDYDIALYLKLLDETSMDSVIRGLDKAEMLKGADITSDAAALLDGGLLPNKPDAVIAGNMVRQNTILSVSEEAHLGRDFDKDKYDYGSSQLMYDADTNQFLLNYEKIPATTPPANVLEYKSTGLTDLKDVEKVVSNYKTYLIAKSVQKLFGSDHLDKTTLTELLGNDKVTQSGYMSEDIEIPTGAVCTQGGGGFPGVQEGVKYPGAKLDFSGMGSAYQIYDVLGMGFNSTCMTCSRHYSVMFTFGDSNGTGYTFNSEVAGGQTHYTMNVDIETMMQKGITTGEQFTKELVRILDGTSGALSSKDNPDSLDFHYSQYAAAGGVLYLCDDRTGTEYFQESTRKNATFDDTPYRMNHLDISFRMQEAHVPSNTMDMEYRYDLTKCDNPLVVPVVSTELVKDPSGEFVKLPTGLIVRYDPKNTAHQGLERYLLKTEIGYEDEKGGYIRNDDGTFGVYDPSDPAHQSKVRYKISINNGADSATKEDWDKFYDSIMEDVAKSTKISLSSDDYSWMNYHAMENENSAVVSTFDFEIEDDKSFWIQTGANSHHGINLEWDGFNAYTLGIGKQNVLNSKNANKLIGKADRAIETISHIRSTFGTYTNRLQHAWAYDENTSENLQAAESKIRDTDMAKAMVENAKLEILGQAGISMIAQSNRINQGVLQMLR